MTEQIGVLKWFPIYITDCNWWDFFTCDMDFTQALATNGVQLTLVLCSSPYFVASVAP